VLLLLLLLLPPGSPDLLRAVGGLPSNFCPTRCDGLGVLAKRGRADLRQRLRMAMLQGQRNMTSLTSRPAGITRHVSPQHISNSCHTPYSQHTAGACYTCGVRVPPAHDDNMHNKTPTASHRQSSNYNRCNSVLHRCVALLWRNCKCDPPLQHIADIRSTT
jgi:hypothetical protein